MEKLLHERLRKWAKNEKNGDPILHEWVHYFGGSLDYPPKDADVWESIADDIERYYVPKHFDENGELWNEHDEAELEGETVIIQGFSEGGMFYEKLDVPGFFWESAKSFKRPVQDSLEKLRTDFNDALSESDCFIEDEYQDKYQSLFDRLTDLIERGK